MDKIELLLKAQKRAITIMNELISDEQFRNERVRLESMTKKQLIEELLVYKTTKTQTTVEECAMRILEAEECEWLPYDIIAAVINKFRPNTTTTNKCIAWYASKGRQEDRLIRNRRKL